MKQRHGTRPGHASPYGATLTRCMGDPHAQILFPGRCLLQAVSAKGDRLGALSHLAVHLAAVPGAQCAPARHPAMQGCQGASWIVRTPAKWARDKTKEKLLPTDASLTPLRLNNRSQGGKAQVGRDPWGLAPPSAASRAPGPGTPALPSPALSVEVQ